MLTAAHCGQGRTSSGLVDERLRAHKLAARGDVAAIKHERGHEAIAVHPAILIAADLKVARAVAQQRPA